MNTSSGNSMMSAISQKNPLLISTVIKSILELSLLSDIKSCRLICRDWNSVAEPLLRKKAKILFTANFGTSDLFKFYSDSCLSAVPFTAFKFTNHFEGNLGYLETDLDYFFNKCGKNIKSLELDHINIWKSKYVFHRMETMNINPWIELLPDNMGKLMIAVYPWTTHSTFNLENLTEVKSVSLYSCQVIVNSSNINRIAPSEIVLKGVTFLNQRGNELRNIIVNDFVDFSNCSNIKLHKLFSNTDINFDMSKDIVNAKKIEFNDIQVLHSEVSKIKTDFLSVNTAPSEAIKMQMKELDITVCSSINLLNLPQTIEKLTITKNLCVPYAAVPLNLPNLKHLHFDPPISMREDEGVMRVFEMVSWFKNCPNLVDVHLGGLGCNGKLFELNVAWLPKCVKRLKLTKLSNILLLGDAHPINVEVLLLDDSMNSLKVEMLMEKIIPKVLVKIIFASSKECQWKGSERAEDFISFLKKNAQLEKIVINMPHGLGMESSSGKKCFLEFVGEESSCYEFNNQIAKAISKGDFVKYYTL